MMSTGIELEEVGKDTDILLYWNWAPRLAPAVKLVNQTPLREKNERTPSKLKRTLKPTVPYYKQSLGVQIANTLSNKLGDLLIALNSLKLFQRRRSRKPREFNKGA